MEMAFSPLWIEPQGSLGGVVEGETIVIVLDAAERAVAMADIGTSVIVVDEAVSDRVQWVKVAGQFVTPSVSDGEITIPTTTSRVPIEINVAPDLSFSILHGELPPGLTIDRSGTISGTVGNVIGTKTYDFTVRMSNGSSVRDRAFSLLVTPVNSPTIIETHLLPVVAYDADYDLSYRDLGSVERVEAFSFEMVMRNADGVLPQVRVRPFVGLPYTGFTFGGLPPGLRLEGTTIEGTVSARAMPGDYFFIIEVLDLTHGIKREMFRLSIGRTITILSQENRRVDWLTPEGSLGSLFETDPCPYGVKAMPDTVRYELAPRSPPLPPGLSLHPFEGTIQGFAGHVEEDTVFSFTVRARNGEKAFSDRTFSLTVKNRYDIRDAMTVMLLLRSRDRNDLQFDYRDIVSDRAFRSFDPAFSARPYINVIHGLDPNRAVREALLGDGRQGLLTNDYYAQIDLRMGEHRLAVARDEETGLVLYEVIYRILYDPGTKAGGFSRVDERVVEQPVAYPQDQSLDLFPISIRNMRHDLARDIGFAVDDVTQKDRLGFNGPELLPLWMRCEQVLGDPSSRIGHVPAITVAFVAPGKGVETMRDIVRNLDRLTPQGRILTFDRFTIEEKRGIEVTFDGVDTLFDDGQTGFVRGVVSNAIGVLLDNGGTSIDGMASQQNAAQEQNLQRIGVTLIDGGLTTIDTSGSFLGTGWDNASRSKYIGIFWDRKKT